MKLQDLTTLIAIMISTSVFASPLPKQIDLTTPTTTLSSTTATPTPNPYGDYKHYGQYASYGKYGAEVVQREANHDNVDDAKEATTPAPTTSSSAVVTPTANPYGNYKNYGQYAGYGNYASAEAKREAAPADNGKIIKEYGIYSGYSETNYHNR